MSTEKTLNEVVTELKAAMEGKERRHRNFHILLVGASGAGKTSLLNLIGQLGSTNEGLTWDKLVSSDFKLYNDAELERAPEDPMVSKTSRTKVYNIQVGDVVLKIADSPGLGVDSAGIGKEKENVVNIVQYLTTVDYVDCVCLVINGRTPRETTEVKYALSEISALLPNVISTNMIMCLTNTDTISKISFKREVLDGFFKCKIEKDKTFCIDNPLCEVQNAKQSNEMESINQIGMLKNYELAMKEFKRMLLNIKDFNPLPTSCFLEVYQAKLAIEREVLTISVHQYNQSELDRLNVKITDKVKFTRVSIIEDKHYNTVCDYPGCYSNCHIKCQLPHSFDSEVFKHCTCMGGSMSICEKCKHSYTTHYHNFARFHRHEVDMVYKKIADQIKSEASLASERLSENITKFNTLSSAKNYVQVLKNQLEVVQLHLRCTKITDALQAAQKRLESSITAIELGVADSKNKCSLAQ